MSKRVLIGLVVGILIVGSGTFILSNIKQPLSQQEQGIQSAGTSLTADEAPLDSSDSDVAQDSRYADYSKAAFEQAGGKRRVLFFYASWCPTCRPADADFKSNQSEIPSDITVLRVNYNDPDTDEEEKALAQKYGVTYQHTYVLVDADGNEIKKWNGGQLSELLTNAT